MRRVRRPHEVEPVAEPIKRESRNDRATPDRVAARAYRRYEERGREDGYDVQDWLDAERELNDIDDR
jgi:hypothetical protein